MKKILIINGVPRAGKDTFVDSCRRYFCEDACIPHLFHAYSSVDTIKEIAYNHFGWSGEKDEAGRALISELKDAATRYNDGPFLLLVKKIIDMPAGVLLLYIREPPEIEKVVQWCNDNGVDCETVLIQNTQAEKDNHNLNTGDSSVFDYRYTFTVANNEGLYELDMVARTFMDSVVFTR